MTYDEVVLMANIAVDIQNKKLAKIRAEINAMSGDIETIVDVLQIIDKYKAESEDEK